jgi:hypothetical protein
MLDFSHLSKTGWALTAYPLKERLSEGGYTPHFQMAATKLAAALLKGYLELPSIGWQLFILDSSQSDSTAFLSCLDT